MARGPLVKNFPETGNPNGVAVSFLSLVDSTLFNSRPPQSLKEMSMNELTTVTQRDKWEAQAEEMARQAEQIRKEFETNPDLNPFKEVTK